MRGSSYPEYQRAVRDRLIRAHDRGKSAGAAAVATANLAQFHVGEAGGPYREAGNLAAYWAAVAAHDHAIEAAALAAADGMNDEELDGFRGAFARAFFGPLEVCVRRPVEG